MRLFLALLASVVFATLVFSGYLLKKMSDEKIDYIVDQDLALFAARAQILAYRIEEELSSVMALEAVNSPAADSLTFEALSQDGALWDNPTQSVEILSAVNQLLPPQDPLPGQISLINLEGRNFAARVMKSAARSKLALQPLPADFFKKWQTIADKSVHLAIINRQSQVLVDSNGRSADAVLRDPIVQSFVREPLLGRSFRFASETDLRLGAYHIIPGSNLVLFASGSHAKVNRWSDQMLLSGLKVVGALLLALFLIIMIFDYLYNKQVINLCRDIAGMPFAHPGTKGLAKEFLPVHAALASTRQVMIRLLEGKS